MPERWILSRLQAVMERVHEALEKFEFSDAANAIYHFVYDELCDWYIEMAKPALRLSETDDAAHAANRHVVQGVLATCLETTMRLFHPFAPFVTEEIWQKLPKKPELPNSLMVTLFPRAEAQFVDAAAERDMELLQSIITACRMLKATYGLAPAQVIAVELRITTAETRRFIDVYIDSITDRAKVKVTISTERGAVSGAARAMVGSEIEVVMPLGGLVDPAVESTRIARDIERAPKEIAAIEARLGKPVFVAKSPAAVVAENRARLVEEQAKRTRLEEALATLGGGA